MFTACAFSQSNLFMGSRGWGVHSDGTSRGGEKWKGLPSSGNWKKQKKTADCAFILTQYTFTCISLCPALSLSLLERTLKKRTWSLVKGSCSGSIAGEIAQGEENRDPGTVGVQKEGLLQEGRLEWSLEGWAGWEVRREGWAGWGWVEGSGWASDCRNSKPKAQRLEGVWLCEGN